MMFETFGNPIFAAGVVLAGLVVLIIFAKILITTWRTVFWKPKKSDDFKPTYYTRYQFKQKEMHERDRFVKEKSTDRIFEE
jgi:hypothetical protein